MTSEGDSGHEEAHDWVEFVLVAIPSEDGSTGLTQYEKVFLVSFPLVGRVVLQ